MALPSTSRAKYSYIAEATFGTTPVSGNGTSLRATGDSLDISRSKAVSEEIRDDRQRPGATTVDASAGGDLNIEMQYNEYDPFIAAVLMDAWTVYGTNGVGATFTGTMATGTITAGSATSGGSIFTILKLGQWFKLNAPGGLNDAVWFKVSSSVAPTSTVITLDASTPAQAESGITLCSVATSRLTNGTTQTSYSLEKTFSDVTQFLTYTGQVPSKFALKFASGSLTKGSFSFMGKTGVRNGSTQMPGSLTASKTFEIMNSVRGMSNIWEGTAPLTSTYLKSLDLMIDNENRNQDAVANLGPVGIGSGDFKPSGSFSAYFATGALYDKFLADTYTALMWGTKDAAGNGYMFTLPRVQLMTGKVVAAGKNQDVMAEFTFEGFSDDANATSALRKTMFIDRLGVAAT